VACSAGDGRADAGPGGHDAPLYDVVAVAKEVDTDVLVLREAWVPDDEGQVVAIAAAGGYRVAATFAVARATCHDQVRLAAREGTAGDGDWMIAAQKGARAWDRSGAGTSGPPCGKGGR
jgi:hypothetical protein